MSLLRKLSDPESWNRFCEYKSSLACPKDLERELRAFLDSQAYLSVCRLIEEGGRFPLPRKAVISKMHSQKKRTVYIYPRAENTVLKLLTWLMLRRYDPLFSSNLYSFRPGTTAKDAMRRLTRLPGIRRMYSYKADISNYFNSIPVDRFLPRLREALQDDPELFRFLESLLTEPEVLERGVPVREEKGIMAGTPLSAFYANLYLRDLDRHFAEAHVPYARYSDDIILFARSREETEAHAAYLRQFLAENGLTLNPAKESFRTPEEGWAFLGFSCTGGILDIAPASVEKLKGKMRRKTHALKRWQERNGLSGTQAAKAFIRIFNRKLLESAHDSDLSWSEWYFSVLQTTASLHTIDLYAQDCLRFLLSGKRTKARFDVRYGQLKELGYRSLVHAYYAYRPEKEAQKKQPAEDRAAGSKYLHPPVEVGGSD